MNGQLDTQLYNSGKMREKIIIILDSQFKNKLIERSDTPNSGKGEEKKSLSICPCKVRHTKVWCPGVLDRHAHWELQEANPSLIFQLWSALFVIHIQACIHFEGKKGTSPAASLPPWKVRHT